MCTEELIQQFVTDCVNSGDCADFEAGGQHETCGACMSMSDAGDSEYGPVVVTGLVRETNLAGCIELVGEAACAEHIQARVRCEHQACIDSCPVTDSESFAAYQQCKQEASTGVCASFREAASCVTDPAHAEACTGSGFEEAVVALGLVFCAGG